MNAVEPLAERAAAATATGWGGREPAAPVVGSTTNPAVKAARRLARRRARRGGALLVEGPQAVREAIGWLDTVFVEESAPDPIRELAQDAADAGARLVVVTVPVLDSIATTVTPQGIVGVAHLDPVDLTQALAGARLAVLCCGLADPGNLGTILRTADAVGADVVIVAAGSVDACNPKAVRSSAGSLFHLPVVQDVAAAEALTAARAAGLRIVGCAREGSCSLFDADLRAATLLVIGAEADGLPPDVAADCDELVAIPMHETPRPGRVGVAESLNAAVAMAVVSYEALRQRERQ